MKKYNWGILGAGKIARKFTNDFEDVAKRKSLCCGINIA